MRYLNCMLDPLSLSGVMVSPSTVPRGVMVPSLPYSPMEETLPQHFVCSWEKRQSSPLQQLPFA